MNRRRGKKNDMDELDDVLGDLLGDDDDPPKKTPTRGRQPGTAGKQGPSVFDDAFYSNLAAEAESQSDVSDANPNEIATTLAELDDMDSALFSSGKVSGNRASTPKSPATKMAPIPGKPGKKPTKSVDIDFDEDDPLAGLLSDEEDSKPKMKATVSRSKQEKEIKKQEAKPASPDKDEDTLSQNSRRLEIERPPTRSGNQERRERKARQDDISFDDDDVLGGMGLESPGRKPAAIVKANLPEDDSTSFLASLGIGKSSSAPEKPGSGSRRPETFLDRLEKKTASTKPAKETKEEDVTFGGYMPSAAQGGSRPSSHRSVRFEDYDERPTSRSSTPGGRRGRGGSYLDDLLAKDDTDWLDMAAGGTTKSGRPASDGNIRHSGSTNEKEPQKPTSATSEPVDWLGLSRLGSPDTKESRTRENPRDTATPDKPLRSVLKTPPLKEDRKDDRPAKDISKKSTDDWLGLGDSDKEDDWLTASGSRQKPDDDWLAPKDTSKRSTERKADKLAAVKRQDSHVDDWLGTSNILGPDLQNESFSDTAGTVVITGTRAGVKAPRTPPTSAAAAAAGDVLPDEEDDLSATLQALKSERAGRGAATGPVTPAKPTPVTTEPSSSVPDPALFVSQQSFNNNNTFQQQQQMLMQQQQMQEQMERQVLQMRQQQEQQMKAWQQQQQQQMMQQLNNPMQEYQNRLMLQQQLQMKMAPSFSLGMSGFTMPGMEDLESKAKRLEFEKQHLEVLFESARKQHEQELQLIISSYNKRMQLMEETFEKRETRLREENELLGQQWMSKLQMLEQEKSEILASSMRRQENWEKGKQDEISRLKQLHREELQKLREDQEEALSRMRKAKDMEIDVISTSQSHTKSLQLVMEQISANARDLSDLHKAVEGHNHSSLEEREMSVKTRDQLLKSLQERLERQDHENGMERARLQGLISKLENQLIEQTRFNEEEKWLLIQEKNRLSSLQSSLERERTSLQEQVKRERQDLQRAKESLLEEQRTVLSQLHEERRLLAEEKAQFNINQRFKVDQEQQNSLSYVKNEAELNSSIRLLVEKKQQLEWQAEERRREKEQLDADRSKLEQERRMLEIEKDKLQQSILRVNQMSQEIDDSVKEAVKAREEGNAGLNKARQMEAEQMQRLHTIQAQLQALRDKEKHIAEERISLAKEKQSLQQSWNTVLCASCRTPIRDTGSMSTAVAATNLYNSLEPEMRSKVDSLSEVAKSIQVDRTVRMWRIAADKDKEFLKEESMFLEALKHTPYH